MFVGRLRARAPFCRQSQKVMGQRRRRGSDYTLLVFLRNSGNIPDFRLLRGHVDNVHFGGAASEEDMRFADKARTKNVRLYGDGLTRRVTRGRTGAGLEEAARTLLRDFLLQRRRGSRRRGRNRAGIIGDSGGDCAISRGAGERYPWASRDALAAGKPYVRRWTRSRRRCARICGASVSHGARTKPTPARITRNRFAVRRCLRWRRLIPTRWGGHAAGCAAMSGMRITLPSG